MPQVIYTLWVRFASILSNDQSISARWGKPVPLSFFGDDPEYLKRFRRFSIVEKLQLENAIVEYGSRCEAGSPVINYGECSKSFIDLWKDAGRSMAQHVRKDGPTIVPSGAALIWPGLSLGHFLGSSIPAWSSHGRNITQVFSPTLLPPSPSGRIFIIEKPMTRTRS